MRAACGISILLVIAAAALGLSGRSRAAPPPAYEVTIQAVYDKHGDPLLVANFAPDGGLAKARWAICRPPHVNWCVLTDHVTIFDAGRTPRGTVFEASATYRGHTYIARTGAWQGTVHALTRPTLTGRPRRGATVVAHRARWAGGWRHNFDHVSVEACRTRAGRHCVPLSAPDFGLRRPPVISATYRGWFLFAFDERDARGTAFALPGLGSPTAAPPLKVGPTVARSAPVGPVT